MPSARSTVRSTGLTIGWLSLFLLFTQSEPGLAQGKKKGQKKPAPIKQQSYKIDFLALSMQVSVNNKAKAEDIAKVHVYEDAQDMFAPARLPLSGQYRSFAGIQFEVVEHDPIKSLSFDFKSGRLLKFEGIKKGEIKSVVDFSKLQVVKRLVDMRAALKKTGNAELRKQAKKISVLKISEAMSSLEVRKRMLRHKVLEVLREIEDLLVKVGSFKKRPLKDVGVFRGPKDLKAIIANFTNAIGAELWWRLTVRYQFRFDFLGRGAEDTPRAAFVPGRLSKDVGSILVQTNIIKGKPRVLWFCLPGYKDNAHFIDELKRPKDWLFRIFKPGQGSRGALVFIKVPKQQEAVFQFRWARKNASGKSVTVKRPPSSPSPF